MVTGFPPAFVEGMQDIIRRMRHWSGRWAGYEMGDALDDLADNWTEMVASHLDRAEGKPSTRRPLPSRPPTHCCGRTRDGGACKARPVAGGYYCRHHRPKDRAA